jgi:hypothetical protein
MKPAESTAAIIAFKALNRDVDQRWVDWAVDMLMVGFTTENLMILAGESEPFNQFELQKLTAKVLDELHLDYSDKDKAVKQYVYYLVSKAIRNEIETVDILAILKNLYIELDHEIYLSDFDQLYCAKEALYYSDNQWYWPRGYRSNIDVIIWDYFTKWKMDYEQNEEVGI